MGDALRTTWRKITGLLDGVLRLFETDTTPLELLSMLAVVMVFIFVYTWLDEIQAFVRHLFV